MTPSDLEAIRARDAEMGDADVRFVRKSLADRRALLAYVDALLAAAGKVTCWVCQGTGIDRGWPVHNPPCYACADLRRLLGEKP